VVKYTWKFRKAARQAGMNFWVSSRAVATAECQCKCHQCSMLCASTHHNVKYASHSNCISASISSLAWRAQ
jgi:hypothetical protein